MRFSRKVSPIRPLIIFSEKVKNLPEAIEMPSATYHRRARYGFSTSLAKTCSIFFDKNQNLNSMRKSICKLDESDLHRMKRNQQLIVGKTLIGIRYFQKKKYLQRKQKWNLTKSPGRFSFTLEKHPVQNQKLTC